MEKHITRRRKPILSIKWCQNNVGSPIVDYTYSILSQCATRLVACFARLLLTTRWWLTLADLPLHWACLLVSPWSERFSQLFTSTSLKTWYISSKINQLSFIVSSHLIKIVDLRYLISPVRNSSLDFYLARNFANHRWCFFLSVSSHLIPPGNNAATSSTAPRILGHGPTSPAKHGVCRALPKGWWFCWERHRFLTHLPSGK